MPFPFANEVAIEVSFSTIFCDFVISCLDISSIIASLEQAIKQKLSNMNKFICKTRFSSSVFRYHVAKIVLIFKLAIHCDKYFTSILQIFFCLLIKYLIFSCLTILQHGEFCSILFENCRITPKIREKTTI